MKYCHLPSGTAPAPSASARRTSAFTLIELLVVIAIIAILAAILFPVFAQAREKARQTSCLSNLKQFGNALMMYTQDYDEMLPMGWTSTNNRARDWTTDLLPYIKMGSEEDAKRVNEALASSRPDLFSARIPFYQCPSKGPSRDSRGFRRGYGYNWWLGTVPSTSLAAISAPAECAAFAEIYGEVDRVFPFKSPNSDGRFLPEARHSDGLNLTFSDGHAKWYKKEHPGLNWPQGVPWGNPPKPTFWNISGT